MKLYKVPKILLLHLKRFKNSSSGYGYGSSRGKLSEIIESPIEDLDLSEYVMNFDLPMAYFNTAELTEIYSRARNENTN